MTTSATALRAAGFPLRTAVEGAPETQRDPEYIHGRLLVANFVLMGIWKTFFSDPFSDLYGALDEPLSDLLLLVSEDALDITPERKAGVHRQLLELLFRSREF